MNTPYHYAVAYAEQLKNDDEMKQEPVAWIIQSASGEPMLIWNDIRIKYDSNIVKQPDIPLYINSVKELTDEEIEQVWDEVFNKTVWADVEGNDYVEFAKAILKKATEK